ncbi:MAG: type III secretion inner membrane ring lipoprotein SctJ [Puniceicoccales bacterium]|jgi:type III secretion protein J|nr:type III secretion inner membrane ring lipoprotein SctJ [Puniceicoccales bacterium]
MKSGNFPKKCGALCFSIVAVLLAGCGKVDLLSNLPEKEANEIFALMQQSGIPIVKKPGVEMTWTIVLNNSSDFSNAIRILGSKGYPNVHYNTLGQVFQKSGFISSPLEERARFMYALSESIADTLNKIPGVLTSRVHVVLPEIDSYADENTEASASIFLTYKAGTNLDEAIREIKYLVANSVQGLDYDRVSIAMFPVTFDVEDSENGGINTNVNVLGLSMASSSAVPFIIIVTALLVLFIGAIGAAAFFFFDSKKAKRTAAGVRPQAALPAPVVVQSGESAASELDEDDEADNEGKGK